MIISIAQEEVNVLTMLGVGGLLADSGEWIAYHVAILFAVQLVLQFLLLPETLYPRAVMVLEESRLKINGREKPTSSKVTLPRTKQLGYFVRSFLPPPRRDGC